MYSKKTIQELGSSKKMLSDSGEISDKKKGKEEVPGEHGFTLYR
jgi:hypothetical protein